VCRLTREGEAEAREAIRRGDGARVEKICEKAERVVLELENPKAGAIHWGGRPNDSAWDPKRGKGLDRREKPDREAEEAEQAIDQQEPHLMRQRTLGTEE
jgi:hypothetical protein